LFVQLKPGSKGDARLTVSYAGKLMVDPREATNALSLERIELSADSLWYPLSERFSTRFTLDARISGVPRAYLIASPDQVRPLADGFGLHRVRPTPDIALVAAPGLQMRTRGGIQFFARDFETDQARNYLENGPNALAYFERWFGPLPAGKVAVAIVQRKDGTGYSRPGYLVVADVVGKATGAWPRYGYIAHELSHSWWSNADFTSEDYWLVESTAEYAALRFIESRLGADAIKDLLEKKQIRSKRAGPILGHGRPSDDAVYAMGPLLLFELEKAIGRDKLDAILAALARRDTITTADFLDLLGARAGVSARDAFEARLRAP
jgi:hypothetical protein